MKERVNIAFQIMEEVNKLNAMGVIHNDLNLGNIMIDKNNKVHLIDYGKAIDLSNKPKDFNDVFSMCGNLAQWPPEMKKFYNDLIGKEASAVEMIDALKELKKELEEDLPPSKKEELEKLVKTSEAMIEQSLDKEATKFPYSLGSEAYAVGVIMSVVLPDSRLLNLLEEDKDKRATVSKALNALQTYANKEITSVDLFDSPYQIEGGYLNLGDQPRVTTSTPTEEGDLFLSSGKAVTFSYKHDPKNSDLLKFGKLEQTNPPDPDPKSNRKPFKN